MSILDVHEGSAARAAPYFVQPPRPEPKFSAWSAIPRGVAQAGLEVAATGAELYAGLQWDATHASDHGGLPREAWQSETADNLRALGRSFRPDPQTASTAEQVLYGFARGASKVVAGAVAGGVPGVLGAGLEEMNTVSADLKAAGIDPSTRDKAALVQGAGLALAALPVIGQTLPATAALYLAGGPGGFIAQQALTRKILQDGGYQKKAVEFDPFDPVGLAVATLVPAGFAAWGIRGQRIAAAAKAAEDFRTGPVPSELTPVARAADEALIVPRETVDAAMVDHLKQQRAASALAPDVAAHEAALAKAEAAIARGDPVAVDPVVAILELDETTGRINRTDVQPINPLHEAYRAAIEAGDEPAALDALASIRDSEGRGAISEDERAVVAAQTRTRPLSDAIDQLRAIREPEAASLRDTEAAMNMARGLGESIDKTNADAPTAARMYRAEAKRLRTTAASAPTPDIATRTNVAADMLQTKAEAIESKLTPRDLRAEVVALRRTDIVLSKLLDCLGA